MNPMTNVKNITKLSELELKRNLKSSWHDQYKDSAWIFIGGLPYDLTEGDVICVFSQYGEVVNLNLVRDKATGKTKGFCFLCYEDQRSSVLAVDNLNGIKLLGRVIRVDHVSDYKPPKDSDKLDDETRRLNAEGCASTLAHPVKQELGEVPVKSIKKEKEDRSKTKSKKEKKKKKRKKKKKKQVSSSDDSSSEDNDSDAGDSEASSEDSVISTHKKHKKSAKKRKKKCKEVSSDNDDSTDNETIRDSREKRRKLVEKIRTLEAVLTKRMNNSSEESARAGNARPNDNIHEKQRNHHNENGTSDRKALRRQDEDYDDRKWRRTDDTSASRVRDRYREREYARERDRDKRFDRGFERHRR